MVEDNQVIRDCSSEIDKIKLLIEKDKINSNIKFLVSYSIIKTCGSIEIIFKTMIHEYLSKGCIDHTAKYLERSIIDSSMNPNTNKIKDLICQFDGHLGEEFENKVKEGNLKNDLNSLVRLRNTVAHGRDVTVGISTVEQYYQSGIRVLMILEELLFKDK